MNGAEEAPQVVTVPEGAVIAVAATESSAVAEAAVEIAKIEAETTRAQIQSSETVALASMQPDETPSEDELSWQDGRDVLQAQLDELRQEMAELRTSQLMVSEALATTVSTLPSSSEAEPEPERMMQTDPQRSSEAPADPPEQARRRLRRL